MHHVAVQLDPIYGYDAANKAKSISLKKIDICFTDKQKITKIKGKVDLSRFMDTAVTLNLLDGNGIIIKSVVTKDNGKFTITSNYGDLFYLIGEDVMFQACKLAIFDTMGNTHVYQIH